jgi:hypothetical protein
MAADTSVPQIRHQLAPQPVAPAQVVAGVLGAVLLVLGLVGLAAYSSTGHSLFHVGSGVMLLGGLGSNARARKLCGLFGLAYLVVAIVGLAGEDDVFGFISVDTMGDVLHGVVALIALGAAAISKDRRGILARDRVVVHERTDPTLVVGPGSGHVGGPRATQPRIDRRLPQKQHP